MRTIVRMLSLWAVAGALWQPVWAQEAPQVQELAPTVLLISIDGFRHDYLDRYAAQCPTLNELATEGVRADGLIPVFPTLTFPSHYSIVTGLHPGKHGIVANTIYSAERQDTFFISRPNKVQDARWWGGEPIWVTAQKQGLRSGAMFWPGSEAPISGMYPTFWKRYQTNLPHTARIDTLLRWLDLPAAQRPQLLTLYFSAVDSKGHDHGPNSREVQQAVDSVDRALDYLTKQLQRRGLMDQINLIIVSDHGMATADTTRDVRLESLLPADWLVFSSAYTAGGLYIKPGMVDAALDRVKDNAGPYLRAYKKGQTPARWQLGTHPNLPDIVLVSSEGGLVLRPGQRSRTGGHHGYDNRLRSMHGILVARGPAFRQEHRMGRVSSIHLYALMCQLLKLKPAPNDGSAKKLKGMLR